MNKFDGVANTLFVPLVARINISKKFPEYFMDEKALELEKYLPQGADKGSSEYSNMASVARYYNMDKTVTAFAKSYAESNIVYLGAGLETAYDRLSDKIENRTVHWYEADLRLKGIGDATTYCPDDNEMKIGFETSKLVNLQSKGIIYLLESKIRSDNSSTALLGFNNYSLEHLMPKKWRNNWGACATEDDAKKRDSLLLTLGNLAIIPQALNASIRDAAWNVKKAGKGQNKPGLLLCASGLYTLHDVLQKNDWNEHEIENRAEWLLANAQNIWKI